MFRVKVKEESVLGEAGEVISVLKTYYPAQGVKEKDWIYADGGVLLLKWKGGVFENVEKQEWTNEELAELYKKQQ